MKEIKIKVNNQDKYVKDEIEHLKLMRHKNTI